MAGAKWVWATAGLLALSLLLGLGLVWCNIERMDLAYGLKTQQVELERVEALIGKLELERNNLLSPHRLRAKATELGLGPAGQGRLRRITDGDKDPQGPPEE
ncbi:hypothetical protein [Desulfovibrio ferrophilus]|uniref:Cell division protein FtsL n=1 Tax=Desulfovibrio ferrophilus TaxID=241368 RepID=A0A2Z6AZ56_9BACT|nr:hypothetical protein [Desulfovibrio ferrophilus]BBD08551.1 uncharacterized protein DFE_1825 [Desulfovibrio ferrophilus]